MLNKINCPVGKILVNKDGLETKALITSSLTFLPGHDVEDFTIASGKSQWSKMAISIEEVPEEVKEEQGRAVNQLIEKERV